MTLPRTQLLEEAANLITSDREQEYGDPAVCLDRIARGWSIILADKLRPGVTIDPHEVALLNDWQKTVRIVETPDKADSWRDKLGYTAIGWEALTKFWPAK